MESIEANCKDCGKSFFIDEREQTFYQDKGWNLPKRCYDCRQINKAKKLEEEKNNG